MSKESFKTFARNHKELVDYTVSGKTTWQRLYELYEIYGEDSSIWDEYFIRNNSDNNVNIKDIFNTIKNVDLDSVQKGITNIQKTIGLLQDIGVGNNKKIETRYESRPMYRYFED